MTKGQPPLQPAPRWHYLAIFLIPGVLWLINPNWLFENVGHMDPWYYFGLFKTFPRFSNLTYNYPGERMVWVFPGWVLVHLFGQVPGVIVLHCSVFLLSLFLLHYILRRLCDNQTAFAGAVLLGCHSCFIGSNGWDYVESMSIALLFANIAILLGASFSERSGRYLFFSGMAWAALMYSYLGWACLTPAYLYLSWHLTSESRRTKRHILLSIVAVLCGGIATSCILAAIYYTLGGHGIFFSQNVMSAIGLSHMTKNPYLGDRRWYVNASWLVFPALAFGTAVALALSSLLQKVRLPKTWNAMAWFYLLCSAAMIYLTFRENRLLAFSYFASILMPGAFIILGIALLRVPAAVPRSLFYATIAIGGLISVAQLAVNGLYLQELRFGQLAIAGLHARELKYGLTIPLLLAGTAVIWRLIDRSSPAFWSISVLFLCGASFGLAPGYPSTAWFGAYRGADISERVSRAMDAIIKRLPKDRYPVFWIDNNGESDDHLTPEYRGIMCSFMTHGESMYNFPKVDRHYDPGVRIVTATERRDITAGALYRLARAGMAVSVVGQDPISYRGTSYWITSLVVVPSTMENMRQGFRAVHLSDADAGAFDAARSNAWEKKIAPFRERRMTFAESGVYQFELHYRLARGSLTFGSPSGSGSGWIERNDAPMEEGGEQVSWFRFGVKAGEPVDVAVQLNFAPNARSRSFLIPPTLTVFQDASGASPKGFDLVMDRPSLGGNMIRNGDFENASEGWDWVRGDLRGSADCHSGSCVEFDAWGGSLQYVTHWKAAQLHLGGLYEFTAWIKAASPAPQPLEFGVWDPNANRWVAHRIMDVTDQWMQVRISFRNDSPNPIATEILKTTPYPAVILIGTVTLKEVGAP